MFYWCFSHVSIIVKREFTAVFFLWGNRIIFLYNKQNNTWCGEIWNLFRVLTGISHEWAKRTSEISCSTREMNFVLPSIHVHYSVYFININTKNGFSLGRWNDIFTRKNIVFLCVLKYDFSQWPKTLYHTNVYEIKNIFSWTCIVIYSLYG